MLIISKGISHYNLCAQLQSISCPVLIQSISVYTHTLDPLIPAFFDMLIIESVFLQALACSLIVPMYGYTPWTVWFTFTSEWAALWGLACVASGAVMPDLALPCSGDLSIETLATCRARPFLDRGPYVSM